MPIYTKLCSSLILGGVFIHSSLLSAAPIVDASINRSAQLSTSNSASPNATPVQEVQDNRLGSVVYQLQTLQAEMRELRGILEEQAHLIRRLDKKRTEDYKNLDKRLLELSNNAVAVGDEPAVITDIGGIASLQDDDLVAAQGSTKDPKLAYRNAYGLIKPATFDKAIIAFDAFVNAFDKDSNTPMAYYWLGELYLLKSEAEKARESLTLLVQRFPTHRKVPDATFKLAKAYLLLDDKAKAKQLAEQAIADFAKTAPSVAKQAEQFLASNFSSES